MMDLLITETHTTGEISSRCTMSTVNDLKTEDIDIKKNQLEK